MLNPAEIKHPGVYIDEVPKFPPSVAAVATAIPAFVGYTAKLIYNGQSLQNRPVRIVSLTEYQAIFGEPFSLPAFSLNLTPEGKIQSLSPGDLNTLQVFKLYQSLQLYFANGGGPCWIVAVNDYYSAPDTPRAVIQAELEAGLDALAKEDEPTLIVLPDLPRGDTAQYHAVLRKALKQGYDLKDRFVICDLRSGDVEGNAAVEDFRNGIGTEYLSYGAVYHPWLRTIINFEYAENLVNLTNVVFTRSDGTTATAPATLAQLKSGLPDPANPGQVLFNLPLHESLKRELARQVQVLPPSGAIAGVYASIDNTRGVWKAPANFSLNYVREPAFKIDDDIQNDLNIHTTGKSINAIRAFEGKGTLVWGARTLAGNDNEWRYVSVRRFFNFVEESVKKASEPFVFEPNDANTWIRIKSMIENFLTNQWSAKALAGAKPEHAFYVKCGLGETMTGLDVLEGRMIIEIGMAVVRPAEFIILRFTHKMQEA